MLERCRKCLYSAGEVGNGVKGTEVVGSEGRMVVKEEEKVRNGYGGREEERYCWRDVGGGCIVIRGEE